MTSIRDHSIHLDSPGQSMSWKCFVPSVYNPLHTRRTHTHLAFLASCSSCSALRTSSCVCCRMASTLERLRTRSLISSARCLICCGEAGMDSSRTRLATVSMLSGSAPSSARRWIARSAQIFLMLIGKLTLSDDADHDDDAEFKINCFYGPM